MTLASAAVRRQIQTASTKIVIAIMVRAHRRHRYATLTAITLSATMLVSMGMGLSWSQTSSWSNSPSYHQVGTNGNGWVNSSQPSLIQGESGSIGVLLNGHQAEWFDDVGGGVYDARHGSKDALAYGEADDES